MDNTPAGPINTDDILNRIKKRYKHLSKWARGQQVDYFRVFDRDLPSAPFMIDSLPEHWVLWICSHYLSDSQEVELITAVKSGLTLIVPKKIIVKSRKKDTVLKQDYFQTDEVTTVSECGLRFELNLTRYLDTGLFIDHRKTRHFIKTHAKGMRVLNLFAYTGSFSCYALAGGANFVTSVDLNPTYSEWHKKNCDLNGFNPKQYELVTGCAINFLKKRHSSYDIIICDPPSFSQSKRKGVEPFQIQDDALDLMNHCFKNLKANGWVLFSNNYRKFSMDKIAERYNVTELTSKMCSKDFDGKWGSRCWKVSAEYV